MDEGARGVRSYVQRVWRELLSFCDALEAGFDIPLSDLSGPGQQPLSSVKAKLERNTIVHVDLSLLLILYSVSNHPTSLYPRPFLNCSFSPTLYLTNHPQTQPLPRSSPSRHPRTTQLPSLQPIPLAKSLVYHPSPSGPRPWLRCMRATSCIISTTPPPSSGFSRRRRKGRLTEHAAVKAVVEVVD